MCGEVGKKGEGESKSERKRKEETGPRSGENTQDKNRNFKDANK